MSIVSLHTWQPFPGKNMGLERASPLTSHCHGGPSPAVRLYLRAMCYVAGHQSKVSGQKKLGWVSDCMTIIRADP